ncbi:MAG: FAD-dependent oxidoreductase, partial [Chloroflexi bacterium]|nr:FAD-dependent oxidoreductase [Chloroflexota bacterium]
MTASSSDNPRTIVIIGGGFSGTMVAVHLLRSTTVPIIIKLIERSPAVGLGIAYGTREDCHWLNVPAGNMSAFPDDAGHFLRWLENCCERPYRADSFVPRKLYGAYLQTILREAEAEASVLARLERIQDEAVAILPDNESSRIQLQSGATLQADRIVLAVGNFPPSDPGVKEGSFYRSPRYSSDPWSPTVFKDIDPLDSILLIGSGLTTVDLILALKERGHQATIQVISRHGLLPRQHRHSAPYPSFLTIADISSTLRVLLRRVRREIDHAARQGYDWRAVIDSLRPQTQVLWRALTATEKKRFLRHLRPYWDSHRHRIAPEVAATISQLQQSRQLLFHAGCIQSYEEWDDGVDVTYRPRHQHELHTLRVD